ncbi:hypothetical protein [Nonomuraea ceibae]|uniref:hypothetical protein n=1 Tax=Nonomuraea ceibae TaxID=1935170 RepID=UPI001C5EBB69|nr:hypothetical protein [Nonomuraea ceibae]
MVVVLVGGDLLDVGQLRGRAAGPFHHLADRPHPRGLHPHRLDQHFDRDTQARPLIRLLSLPASLGVCVRGTI